MSHDECHSRFYCHEQLTGVRFPDGSTRAAGFDDFNRQIWAVDERGVAVTNAYEKPRPRHLFPVHPSRDTQRCHQHPRICF